MTYPIDTVLKAAQAKLVAAGASEHNALSAAKAMVLAEAEGNPICGLFHLPNFIKQIEAGRVNGQVEPVITHQTASALTVDAGEGLAHPAIDFALPKLAEKAKAVGVAALTVQRAYHTLALGQFTADLARQGMVGLMFSNAPAACAPLGATRKVYGTNPMSLAAPLADGSVLLIDQSSSATTKTQMEMKARAGEAIPDGWAQTASGQATNDPEEGLKGSILPNGGVKGANIAMIVEILAAVLTGGSISAEAPMFGDVAAPHPKLGMLILAFDPVAMGNPGFLDAIQRFEAVIDSQDKLRLPGKRRADVLKQAQSQGMALKPEQAALLGL